jgi:hypothetical protein
MSIKPLLLELLVTTLVYNLRFGGERRPLNAPDYRAEHGRAVELLQRWASAEDELDKLILPLDHVYTLAELSFSALNGADAGAASVARFLICRGTRNEEVRPVNSEAAKTYGLARAAGSQRILQAARARESDPGP